MSGPNRGYWFECPGCGFLASNLSSSIGGTAPRVLDEAARLRALKGLRRANFERILDAMAPYATTRPCRLLDVGSAHGWFLDAAVLRGYDAVGVEPDPDPAELARSRNHRVIAGRFPEALGNDECFDIITFNDAFEHLDDPAAVAAAVHRHLNPGGLAVVNLPNSLGALFRIARALNAVGIHAPFDRMWQRGFPSPHRSYFHQAALALLFERAGFREVHRGTLPGVSSAGLWSRLRYDGAMSPWSSAVIWLAIMAGRPLLSVLPSDISFHVFERVNTFGAS
jgi:SAM-dependent methyltransferase